MMLHRPSNAERPMTDHSEPRRERSFAERVFGGSPIGVVTRLVLLSLVVGFVMTMLGLDVTDLIRSVADLVRETFRDGAGLFRTLGAYLLTGAAVVVPIWLVLRLTRRR
jgi:hypothetical protein